MSDPITEARIAAGRRQGYTCLICEGNLLTSVPHSFHHRLMRSHGHGYAGLHLPGNLILLCGTGTTGCHGHVHAHPKEAYERGWLVHPWEDPLEKPVWSKAHGMILLDDEGGWRPA